MENIQTFLSTYYLYVVGIGVFVLIMLIGVLSRKAKNKSEKTDKTVDFKDVKTGTITDLVDLNKQPEVTPVEIVADVPNETTVEPAAPVEMVAEPVLEPAAPVEMVAEPMDIAIEQPVTTQPIVEEQPLLNPEIVASEPTVNTVPTNEEDLLIVDPLAEFSMPAMEPQVTTAAPIEEVKNDEPLVDYFSISNKTENNEELK